MNLIQSWLTEEKDPEQLVELIAKRCHVNGTVVSEVTDCVCQACKAFRADKAESTVVKLSEQLADKVGQVKSLGDAVEDLTSDRNDARKSLKETRDKLSQLQAGFAEVAGKLNETNRLYAAAKQLVANHEVKLAEKDAKLAESATLVDKLAAIAKVLK